MKAPPRRLRRTLCSRRRATALLLLLPLSGAALAACSGSSPGTSVGEVVEVAAEADPDGPALLLSPTTSLRGASAYGLIVTDRIRDAAGRALEPSETFARLAGTDGPSGQGLHALYGEDPTAPGNPYPDARLASVDGTIFMPDAIALRGLPDEAGTALARQRLRDSADELEALGGFSTTAPIRVALSAEVDLATVGPDSIFLFELEDPAVLRRADDEERVEALLEAGETLGVDRDEVALAVWFPTLPIEDDLVSVQQLLRERIDAGAATFADPDPSDDLTVGFFPRGTAPFADYLEETPDVSAVAVGLLSSPEFRGADGTWDAARVNGEATAPPASLDFVVTLPTTGAPPYPVVLFQHGFGGSNEGVLEVGALFAADGLATIGISAASHGRRGSPLDLITSTPFQIRDIVRQSNADQMSVLRAIEAGLDVDGDAQPDLDPARMSYLGISLGGIMGATLVAVEEILPVAVLNVAGARIAFLATSEGTRDIYTSALAAEVGLEVGDPRFETFLRRQLEIAQHALDPADGLNFARRWFLEPFPGAAPHRVLVQEGIGDVLVANASTEALAAAGGLEANAARSDPNGVSGLWRFDPPGGHGIFAREDVRAQAIRFLVSGGTEIIDPSMGANGSGFRLPSS